MFRNSWPESKAPLLVSGSPYMTRGGDSSCQSRMAGAELWLSLLDRPKCMPGKEILWWWWPGSWSLWESEEKLFAREPAIFA
jgi:hypothetical protein